MDIKQTHAITRQSKREFWKSHIRNWQDSGLTQDAYCRKHHLKTHSLIYWKKKLTQNVATNALVPVSVKSAKTGPRHIAGPSGVALCVKGQYVVHLEDHFNGSTLSRLIDVLEAR